MNIGNLNNILNSPSFRGPMTDAFTRTVEKIMKEMPYLTKAAAEALASMITGH